MLRWVLRPFGSGRLPGEACHVIQTEHCRFMDERLVGSITLRNFRAPGKYSKWRRTWFLGSLAISDRRLMIYRYRTCLMNLPLKDKRIGSIDFSAETPGVFTILHDVQLLNPSGSGEVEIRLQTSQAGKACATLASLVDKQSVRRSTRSPAR